jgi:hypothetical protein
MLGRSLPIISCMKASMQCFLNALAYFAMTTGYMHKIFMKSTPDWRCDTQQDDIWHNDTQHNKTLHNSNTCYIMFVLSLISDIVYLSPLLLRAMLILQEP